MKFIKTPIKGMCDMLPADVRLREHILSLIKDSYSKYGFMQIETPAMEHIENLCSKQGGDNEKLIFKILKRGQSLIKSLEDSDYDELADSGLRYDLTVPLARYYANNNNKLPSPFKALQIGNVWRAENPQKGRFRQFTQCDIDVLGDDSNLAEIELIAATSDMLLTIFRNIAVSGLTVHINDRRILRAICLQAGFDEQDIASVLVSLDKYDKIGIDGVRDELLSNGYEKDLVSKYLDIYTIYNNADCFQFCKSIPNELLDKSVVDNLNEIILSVKAMVDHNVNIVFDPTLVRGMGYYTSTIFEISIDDYPFSIAGGGRYDEMIGKFSGNNVCACGFSIGFERIITILKDTQGESFKIGKDNLAILVQKNLSTEQKVALFAQAKQLRESGKIVSIYPMKKNLTAQFKKLEEEGYTEFKKVYEDH